MALRGKIAQHRTVVAAACGVLLAGICFFVIPRLVSLIRGDPSYVAAPRELMAYFFDQNTRQLFVAPARHMGPIETETGPYEGRPAGVRAHVYACRSCDDAADRFIAWLEMPTVVYMGDDPELLAKYTPVVGEDEETAFAMIRLAGAAKWVRGDSPEALQIYAELAQRCSHGGRPHVCRPPARRVQ